jgi:hypothetical protein
VPPMLITSSSGCGLKQMRRFGSRPAGWYSIVSIIQRKTRWAIVLGGAVVPQQLVQVVLRKSSSCSLSSGLPVSCSQSQSTARLIQQRRSTSMLPEHPGRGDGGQLAGGRGIDEHRRIGMVAGAARRHAVGDGPSSVSRMIPPCARPAR